MIKHIVLFFLLFIPNISYSQELLCPIVADNNKYGFANLDGRIIVPCIYKHTASISPGIYAAVNNEDEIAFFSVTGLQLTPFAYKKYGAFSEGYILVQDLNEKYGYINEKGEEIIPCTYDKARNFKDGLAAVKRPKIAPGAVFNIESQQWGPSWGYINKKGVDLFECAYEEAAPFSEGLAAVQINGKNGFINVQGELTIKNIYDHVYSFSNGRAAVCRNSKWGFVDTNGNEIIACIYDDTKDFNENGIAAVKDVDKWKFIDKYGKCIFKAEFDEVFDFCEGYARVRIEKDRFFINTQGKIVLSISSEYKAFSTGIGEGFICVQDKNEKYSFIDIDGINRFNITFEDFSWFDEGVAIIKLNSKYGAIDLEGNEVVSCTYDEYNDPQLQFQIFQYKNRIDVDRDIPSSHDNRNNIFVSIISNEKYDEVGISDVLFAKRDGEVFKEYCIKTLGIPEQNIKYKENATLNNIRSQINWLKDITETYNGEAKVIFYYAGHGIPNEANSSSYLLPTDGVVNDYRSAYSLNELYSQLGNLSAKQVTVFLDACFSGAKRNGKMLIAARSVAIKAKSGTPKGNTVVFSAAQGDETAYQYNKKKHGMFTYFLLKKLQETNGNVTLGELNDYIVKNVSRHSIVENSKSQTPTVTPSPNLLSKWRTIKF